MSEDAGWAFHEEMEAISRIGASLLRKLEPEPEYVRDVVRRAVSHLERQDWRQVKDQPWVDRLEREGYVLKIGFVHGRRGERVSGADLIFELKGKKLVLIQAKRVGADGRIHFNRLQLSSLADFEERADYSFLQTWRGFFLPRALRKICFYQLIMTTNGHVQQRVFHIRQVNDVLGSRRSVNQSEFVNQGLREDEFHDQFWRCNIGGPDMPEDDKHQLLAFYCLVTSRLIMWLHVEERGLLRNI